MSFSPLLIIGLGLFAVGFWSIFFALAKRRGLGSSVASMQRGADAFKQPKSATESLALRGGLLAVLTGAVCCFAAVASQTGMSNRSCRSACKTKGFSNGITRGNPHAKKPQNTARACWCYSGRGSARTWAPKSILVPKE